MYARGILFGKMKYELGDHSYVRCPENNLSADIEFKVKGWVSGGYNAIGGYIKNDKTGENYYELSGTWTGEMFAKDLKTGKKIPLFDASHAKHTPPKARPLEEQGERESQKLWREVCKAVHVADHTVATEEKAKIEDRQRQEAHERQEQGIEWQPKLFRRVDARPGGKDEGEEDLEWIIDADIDPHAKPDQIVQQILSIAPILPGQKPGQQKAPQRQTPQQQSAPGSEPAPAPAKKAPSIKEQPQNDNLIDFAAQPHSSSSAASQPQPPMSTTSQPPSSGPAPSQPRSIPPSMQQTSADPIAGNPLHPTSNPKQVPIHEATTIGVPAGNPPRQTSLMDEDQHLNDKMGSMSMQQPLNPTSQGSGIPIKRTDTETSDTEVFVDAQG
ncbi:Oxysterol-binding protein OBPa [Knufia obscura]|uniref:Oxysterol-binding protein OBPa n=2 Tax=Knufia TaxID=430999 RepID=A0AAN8EFG5_9EURO|nr:Oxysterol-binding protein OBPa [Knufia obscura]KAK5948390.1 Oxysterol-binding protein OBPa [Knufia fluminis]